MRCQKEPQEDGWGGEGGTADNIGGEVGSIPPYPTFIPPGPKKLFCRVCAVIFVLDEVSTSNFVKFRFQRMTLKIERVFEKTNKILSQKLAKMAMN